MTARLIAWVIRMQALVCASIVSHYTTMGLGTTAHMPVPDMSRAARTRPGPFKIPGGTLFTVPPLLTSFSSAHNLRRRVMLIHADTSFSLLHRLTHTHPQRRGG